MLRRVSVRLCTTCGETTPHSRRVVALPVLVAAISGLAGVASFLELVSFGRFAGFSLLCFATLVFFWDRERFWHVACERCRGKRVAEVRATDPRFGSTTMIDPF